MISSDAFTWPRCSDSSTSKRNKGERKRWFEGENPVTGKKIDVKHLIRYWQLRLANAGKFRDESNSTSLRGGIFFARRLI